jgi:hypothetical protein
MVNGAPELLRWAMNNISNMHGSETTIGKATEAARVLGWPASMDGTMDMPATCSMPVVLVNHWVF